MKKRIFHVTIHTIDSIVIFDEIIKAKSDSAAIANVLVNKFKTDKPIKKIFCTEMIAFQFGGK